MSYTEFLVLENLAYQLRMPCVLDLKIGTRQHGDDATEAKRLGHTKKCMESTSHSLGLRVCGMQVTEKLYLFESGHIISPCVTVIATVIICMYIQCMYCRKIMCYI